MKSYDTHIHAIPWNCNYNVDLTIMTSQQSRRLHQKENFQFISFETLFLQHLEDVWEQAYISDQSLVSSLGQFFIYKTGNMKSTQLFSRILQTRQWIQKLVTSFNMTINKNSHQFRWHLRNVSCTNIHVIHHVCCHYFKTQHSTFLYFNWESSTHLLQQKNTGTHLFTLLQAQFYDQDLVFPRSLFGQQGQVLGRYKVSAK